MKPHARKIEDILKDSLPSAPRGEMEPALDRVHARLQADRYVTPRESEAHIEAAPVPAWSRPAMRVAAAAIVIAAAVWAGASLRDQNVYAVLEAADGSLYRIAAQETIRSSGAAGAVLSLADGSHVEIRSQSELSWDHAPDGMTIRLDAGSIIVSARKPGRQLYVETKDMTVALAGVAQATKAKGTTFLVNSANDGSRVAVIEGEARVRERSVETTLHPGEEVSTSPTLSARTLKEEIGWSRNAEAHLAVLASFMKGIATTSGPLTPLDRTSSALQAPAAQGRAAVTQGPRFEEASVRECDPDNLPSSPIGARGGGANSLLMTPGRLYVQCMTLATLIRTAYEYGPFDLEFMFGSEDGRGPRNAGMRLEAVYGLGVEDGRRVRGGPDWIGDVRYTIEAVGDPQATAATMRAPMLRDLLERRFQLRVHVESEQIPAYALVVGPGGLKGMKPFRESDCGGEVSDAVKAERARKGWRGPVLITEAAYFGIKPSCGGAYGETNGPNFHIEFASSTPGAIAGTIGGSMGVRVIDRTNITDRFTFMWDFGIDEQTPRALEDLKQGKTWTPKPGWDSPMTIPKAPSILAAVEQLGLKLEPIRVPREFIVVDRVERPSPN